MESFHPDFSLHWDHSGVSDKPKADAHDLCAIRPGSGMPVSWRAIPNRSADRALPAANLAFEVWLIRVMPAITNYLIRITPRSQLKLEPGNPSSQAPVGVQFTPVLVEVLPDQSAVLFNLV